MSEEKYIPEVKGVIERFIRSFEELRYRGMVDTKGEFCKNVGLSNSTSNFLLLARGKRKPSVTNILLLNKNYGVSMNWIMFGSGEFLEKGNKE